MSLTPDFIEDIETAKLLTKKQEATEFSEGDINSSVAGTTARANGGKVQFHLVPVHLLYGCANVMTYGLKKYAPWNWAKGGPWSTPFDSMMRHLVKWWFFGEELDKESGLHHLDHAMCNLLFLIHYRDTYRDGDDRPARSVTRFNFSTGKFNTPYKPEKKDEDDLLNAF